MKRWFINDGSGIISEKDHLFENAQIFTCLFLYIIELIKNIYFFGLIIIMVMISSRTHIFFVILFAHRNWAHDDFGFIKKSSFVHLQKALFLSTFLSFYLSTYLLFYLSIFLPTNLSIFLPNYLYNMSFSLPI